MGYIGVYGAWFEVTWVILVFMGPGLRLPGLCWCFGAWIEVTS